MSDTNDEKVLLKELKVIRIVLIVMCIIFAVSLFITCTTVWNEKKRLEDQSRNEAAITKSYEEQQIDDAKNTTYNDGIVSVIINNITSDAKWKHFIGTNGREVVEVNGMVPSSAISAFTDILVSKNFLNELTYRSSSDIALYTIDEESGYYALDKSKIKRMDFMIQFVRNKDSYPDPDNPYNKYYRSYAEIRITPLQGDEIVKTVNSSIFSIFTDYIANK